MLWEGSVKPLPLLLSGRRQCFGTPCTREILSSKEIEQLQCQAQWQIELTGASVVLDIYYKVSQKKCDLLLLLQVVIHTFFRDTLYEIRDKTHFICSIHNKYFFQQCHCPNPNLTTYKTHLPFIWAWTVWRQNFEIYNLVHIICQVTFAINNLIQYIRISLKGKINISDSKVAFTTQLIKIRNC